MKRREKPSLTEIIQHPLRKGNLSGDQTRININDLMMDEISSQTDQKSNESNFSRSKKKSNTIKCNNNNIANTNNIQYIIDEMNQSKNHLDSFLDQIGDLKYKQPNSQFLKKYLKITFDPIDSFELFQQLYEIDVQKMISSKVLKKNWNKDDIVLLIWLSQKYSEYKQISLDDISDNDWQYISQMIPGKTMDSCKFKWLSMAKVNSNRLPWTKKENTILQQLVLECIDNQENLQWVEISKQLFKSTGEYIFRTSKQCREHYNNFLDPSLKNGEWTEEEDILLIELQQQMGNKWSDISKQIKGRTDNTIKNRYMSLRNKKLNTISALKEYYINKSQFNNRNTKNYDKMVDEPKNLDLKKYNGNCGSQLYEYQSQDCSKGSSSQSEEISNNSQQQSQEQQSKQLQQSLKQNYIENQQDYNLEDDIYLDTNEVHDNLKFIQQQQCQQQQQLQYEQSDTSKQQHQQQFQQKLEQEEEDVEEYREENMDIVNNMEEVRYKTQTVPLKQPLQYHQQQQSQPSQYQQQQQQSQFQQQSYQQQPLVQEENRKKSNVNRHISYSDTFQIKYTDSSKNLQNSDKLQLAYVDLESKEIHIIQDQFEKDLTQQCISLQSITSKNNFYIPSRRSVSQRTSIQLQQGPTTDIFSQNLSQQQQFKNNQPYQQQLYQQHPLENILVGFPCNSLNSSMTNLKISNDNSTNTENNGNISQFTNNLNQSINNNNESFSQKRISQSFMGYSNQQSQNQNQQNNNAMQDSFYSNNISFFNSPLPNNNNNTSFNYSFSQFNQMNKSSNTANMMDSRNSQVQNMDQNNSLYNNSYFNTISPVINPSIQAAQNQNNTNINMSLENNSSGNSQQNSFQSQQQQTSKYQKQTNFSFISINNLSQNLKDKRRQSLKQVQTTLAENYCQSYKKKLSGSFIKRDSKIFDENN